MLSYRRSIIFLILLTLGLPGFSASTREELEAKLFDNNLELKSLQSEIESQNSIKNAAYAGYLPTLNATGGWARNKTDEDDEKGQLGYLEGSMNLFSGLKDLKTSDIEKQKLALAGLSYDLKKQALREELTEILSSMIGLHSLEKILDEEYKITQAQKAMAAKKVNAGLTSSVDNLEFDLRESEILIQRRNNTQLHAEAHEKLNALFNSDIKDEDLDNIGFSAFEKFKSTLNTKSGLNHPDNKKAALEEEIAKLEKQSVTAEFLPKLDVTYAFGRLTPSEEKTDYNESQLAVLVTIPLFSGLDTYWKRKASVANSTAKELGRRQTQLSTKARFERLKAKYDELTDLYKIYEKKVISSEKYYNLTSAEYKRGVKNSPDIVGATERYFDSKKKLIEIQKELELVMVQLNQFN